MCGPFISEEKVMLAVHAHAMCQLTVAKVRKVYNKVDSKSIAKQVRAHSTVTVLNLNSVVWLAKQGSELWVIALAAGIPLQISLNICLVCHAGKSIVGYFPCSGDFPCGSA